VRECPTSAPLVPCGLAARPWFKVKTEDIPAFAGTSEVQYVSQRATRQPGVLTIPHRVYYFVADGLFVTMKPRYVNMPDVTILAGDAPHDRAADAGRPAKGASVRWDIIELLFFAYRDFVGDADDVLRAYGFGRAHHRVLHFVTRYPGLKVADLLDVLRITKQSLGRVLKQLLDEEFIVQKSGDLDRRQRLLYASAKGEALVAKLAGLQTARIDRALADLEAGEAETVRRFLRAMIDRHDPDKVLQTILGATPGHDTPGRDPKASR
jgi:DNA-binding MarR family transcriptional regulator